MEDAEDRVKGIDLTGDCHHGGGWNSRMWCGRLGGGGRTALMELKAREDRDV